MPLLLKRPVVGNQVVRFRFSHARGFLRWFLSLRETHFYIRALVKSHGVDEAHLAFVQGDDQRVRADAFAEEANAAQQVPFGYACASENDFFAGSEVFGAI